MFVEQLAKDPRPWPELQVQAIRQAANAKNLTPKCILEPLPAGEAVVRALPVNDPNAGVGDEWCPVHECRTTQRNDGERLCCWQDRMLDNPTRPRPVAAAFRDAVPAPAGLRERVAASLSNASRAVPGVVKKQEAEQG